MLRALARKLSWHQRKAWQIAFQYIGGFCFVAGLGILAAIYQPAGFFERKSHDWFHISEWFPHEDSDHPLENFLIIYIDDRSHSDLSQPYDLIWDRSLHAELLNKISSEKPNLVFYDIVFDRPSSKPAADSQFAKAIEDSGVVVLAAAQNRYFFEDNENPVEQLLVPAPNFRRAAASWGIALKNYDAEDDGLRKMNNAHADERFPLAYWQAARVVDPKSIEIEGGYETPRWIRYIGPPPSIQSVSFSDALLYDQTDFSGKYIFIGARHSIGMTGAGRDVYRSPYGDEGLGEFPGVELQATMVYNLLNSTWLDVSGDRTNLFVVLLSALLLTIILNPLRPTTSLIAAIFLFFAFAMTSIWIIESLDILYSWLVPVIVQTPAAFIFSNICNYYFLNRKRNQIKRVFSSYLSPVMVQRITEADEEPQLGGKEEIITPFFSDVVGYSKFSEVLSPIELTRLMNDYLGAMTAVLQEEGGTLDKYIGDAIVAFFGAPLPMEDHAYRACRSAVRMQEIQMQLNQKWKSAGDWPDIVSSMQTRIGLNTGSAVVGNMGSPTRFNYSMTGDNVNLAARCESGAKQFGVFTMVTENTFHASRTVSDDLIFRALNRVTVVGRVEPILLLELMGMRKAIRDQELECKALYERALDQHENRDWVGAEQTLKKSIPIERWRPEDDSRIKTNPSLFLLEQVLQFKKTPPTDEWDGVLQLSSK